MLAPAAGREPILLVTVYGVDGAMDDAEKLRRNEEFLTTIVETANAYGDVPICVVRDLNTEPQHSAILSTLILRTRRRSLLNTWRRILIVGQKERLESTFVS